MARASELGVATHSRLGERQKLSGTHEALAQASREPLTLCAPAIPGEGLISQVGRYHVISGNRTTPETFAELFRRKPFPLTQWVPPYIGALSERFAGRKPEAIQRLLRETTLFPLLEMFTGAQFSARDDLDHIDQVLQTLPKRMNGASEGTRLCLRCLVEDELAYGTPAILSAHQIPGVTACFRHGLPLLDRCPVCRCPFERRGDLVMTPWHGCQACRTKLTNATLDASMPLVDEKSVGFARFSAQLLASGVQGATRAGLVGFYRARIRELNLMRGSLIDRGELIQQLVAQFGGDFIKRVDPAYRSDRLSGWFHMLVEYTTWKVHLGRHLLLSYFLFEDAENFLSRYRQVALAPASPVTRYSRRRTTPERRCRETPEAPSLEQSDLMQDVIDASKKIPNCDLDALWREHYGLMKRLVRQDPGALLRLQPHIERDTGRRPKPIARAPLDAHPDDALWTERLRQSVSSFYNGSERPQHGNRSRLLKRIGWARHDVALPKFPQLDLALEAACESVWHSYIRKILWMLVQPSARTWTRSQIIIPSGVEWHRASVLVDYCEKRGIPRNATSSSVMTILRDWQIDLKWEGPCPERVFVRRPRQRWNESND
ncbi:hypothetical protein GNZ10_16880 [Ralstonia sp. 3N]|nr:hypothetical protein [Ralstonia insidiosa]MBA9939297.1 hypothetical protein [Ralstonia insidiosa]NPT51367.1 hypothetical protein [Ralstonia sp. 3N]